MYIKLRYAASIKRVINSRACVYFADTSIHCVYIYIYIFRTHVKDFTVTADLRRRYRNDTRVLRSISTWHDARAGEAAWILVSRRRKKRRKREREREKVVIREINLINISERRLNKARRARNGNPMARARRAGSGVLDDRARGALIVLSRSEIVPYKYVISAYRGAAILSAICRLRKDDDLAGWRPAGRPLFARIGRARNNERREGADRRWSKGARIAARQA